MAKHLIMGATTFTGSAGERRKYGDSALVQNGLSDGQLQALCRHKQVSFQDVYLAERLLGEAKMLATTLDRVAKTDGAPAETKRLADRSQTRYEVLSDLYWSVYANHRQQGILTRLFTAIRDAISTPERGARHQDARGMPE